MGRKREMEREMGLRSNARDIKTASDLLGLKEEEEECEVDEEDEGRKRRKGRKTKGG